MSSRAPILVLDDDPDVVAMLARVLELDGHRVLTAIDGEAALALCLTERPGLVILDLMMPSMDGEQFVAALRKKMDPVTIPEILLLTASSRRVEITKRMGIQASMPKPFELEEVRDLVGQMVDSHRRRSSAPPR